MSETATFPYTDGDVYKALCVSQAIEMNDRFNTPQLVLKVKLTGKLDNKYEPDGSFTELPGAEQVHKYLQLSLEPGERLTRTLRDLLAYGFPASQALETLSPDHAKCFKLAGRTLLVKAQVKDSTKDPSTKVDRWWLSNPTPKNKKMASVDLAKYFEQNADEVKASRTAAAEPAPF